MTDYQMIYKAGAQAYRDNIHMWRNPHKLNSDEFYAWRDGYVNEMWPHFNERKPVSA